MPSEKQPTVPEWQVILEDIQSQNRATIEAVEASRLSLEERIDRAERDSRSRDAVLEMGIRSLGVDVRDLKSVVQESSVDIRGLKDGLQAQTVEIRTLSDKVEAMARIDERVTALEQRRD